MKKITITILSIVFIVTLILIFSPPLNSVSNNPCSSAGCHRSGNYYQYLDIIEGNSENQIPSTLNLGETKTVSVIIQNDVNTATYATLTSVSATLTSARGHFTVSNPTFIIGDLSPGTAIATWQITAVSDGYDFLTIHTSANNPHFSTFSDYYSPSPAITVGQPTVTPEPTQTPTPTPTNPPATATPPTSTPTPAATSTPTVHPTSQPSSSPSISNQTKLSIQLISPNQNEKLLTNTKYDIEWKASGGTSPLNVTLDYAYKDNNDEWANIATGLPSSGKNSWTTPTAASNYYIRVSVEDSASPTQMASTTRIFEIIANNSELPIMPITVVFLVSILIVIIVLALRKRRKP